MGISKPMLTGPISFRGFPVPPPPPPPPEPPPPPPLPAPSVICFVVVLYVNRRSVRDKRFSAETETATIYE